MATFVFPSLKNPSVRYIYLTDTMTLWDDWYRNRSNLLSNHAGKYDTLGDGETQHTPRVPVPLNDMEDYLYSFLVAAKAGEVPVAIIDSINDAPVTIPTIRFLSKLRPGKGKTRYFTIQVGDGKASLDPEKRHDERWSTVPDDADGSTKAIYNLWLRQNEHTTMLDRAAALWAIARWKADAEGDFTSMEDMVYAYGRTSSREAIWAMREFTAWVQAAKEVSYVLYRAERYAEGVRLKAELDGQEEN